MNRRLIVNADDCNLTPGVTRAILECHDKGILSSTTFMINLPIERSTVRELLKRKSLGVGIHLNVTLKKAVAKPASVRSLLGADGNFRKVGEQTGKPPKAADLSREYQAQIDLFKKVFSRKPTHLDTHHQTHDHPLFFRVLNDLALKNKLPVRRSRLSVIKPAQRPAKTTDYIFGNLTKEGYWREATLRAVITTLPQGVSEIMCHPGYNDRDLQAISSFTAGRPEELKLFRSAGIKDLLKNFSVRLAHFGMCYT